MDKKYKENCIILKYRIVRKEMFIGRILNCLDIQIYPKKYKEVPIDEDRQTREPTPIDEITIEPTKEPTIEPTKEPTFL